MTQLLAYLSEIFTISLILLCGAYAVYLIFQKKIDTVITKIFLERKRKQNEKLHRERLMRLSRIEADKRKVEKIRNAYSQALRQSGHAYSAYYAN